MRLGKFLIFVAVLNLVCFETEAKRGKGKKCRKNKNAPGCARRKPRTHADKEVHTVTSLKPLRCNCSYIHCAVPRRHLKCAGSVVKGVCGCCPTCAKQLGEECGGEMTFKGVCDVGMTCKVPSSNSRRSTVQIAVLRNGSADEADTVCVATGTPVTSPEVRGSPDFDTCEPECTAEFCSQKQNKNAICSATRTAVETNGCQRCQHTTCKACFYQQERPPCKKCGPGDFGCIRGFADCARKKTICKKDVTCKRKKPKKRKGEFKCWVPQCT